MSEESEVKKPVRGFCFLLITHYSTLITVLDLFLDRRAEQAGRSK
jgi:hypothetical protein